MEISPNGKQNVPRRTRSLLRRWPPHTAALQPLGFYGFSFFFFFLPPSPPLCYRNGCLFRTGGNPLPCCVTPLHRRRRLRRGRRRCLLCRRRGRKGSLVPRGAHINDPAPPFMRRPDTFYAHRGRKSSAPPLRRNTANELCRWSRLRVACDTRDI